MKTCLKNLTIAINAPSPNYTVEEVVKMVNVKNSVLEGGDEAAYKEFIRQILRYPGTPPR